MNREDRNKVGICYDCHAPSVKGRSRCEKHLKSNVHGIQKYSKTPKGKVTRDKLKPYLAEWRRNNRRTKGRFSYVREHALRRGHEWNLTKDEYSSLISDRCSYCGHINDVEAGVGLDRLDNSEGYFKGNVVSCCALCNVTRSNRFTPDEMKMIGEVIKTIKVIRNASNLNGTN